MFTAIGRWYRKRAYRPGSVVSRFVARDVKREIRVVSADDLDKGYIVGQVRTNNVLYVARGLVAEQQFSDPTILRIDELWDWSGKPWGGLPDGTSIVDRVDTRHNENIRVADGGDAGFRDRLLEHQKPTRELVLSPGDQGCKPITKISGEPWWPARLPRPTCGLGHTMSFMAQFRISDVPGFESETDSLVSFHYCQSCSYEGNMSFGWDCERNKSGYDVSILTNITTREPDGLETVAEVVIKPHAVTCRDVMEVPGYEDTIDLVLDQPDDYPGGKDDLDEEIYPGVVHVAHSKLGGWPTWVQRPVPPPVGDSERLAFVAQLDWSLCDRSPWCSGGYAYLFLIHNGTNMLRGELAIQTT
ncbi:MAG: hypothetical protein AMXMBFR82_38520 [Candidatus Hydrogenedentota bacterium]